MGSLVQPSVAPTPYYYSSKPMPRLLTWILVIGGVLLSTRPVSAQQRAPNGSISGSVVTQDEGRPLAARVWIVGVARPRVPNAKGTFRFDGLLPGRYRLRATYIGFVPLDTLLSITAGSRCD